MDQLLKDFDKVVKSLESNGKHYYLALRNDGKPAVRVEEPVKCFYTQHEYIPLDKFLETSKK